MNFSLNESQQILTLVITLITGLAGFIGYVWRCVLIPALGMLEDHKNIKTSIEIIKKELTPNGGSSLKDQVNRLSATCERIEKHQTIIDQRAKVSFHYVDYPLFETDPEGKVVWTNEKFCELTGTGPNEMEGYDWLSYIIESDRERFLTEFTSCLHLSRKLEIDTKNVRNQRIKFIGYPYKVKGEQSGFLIHVSLSGRQHHEKSNI